MPTLLMNEQECLTCGRFRPNHWHSCWYCNEELVRDSKYLEPYQTREHKDRQPRTNEEATLRRRVLHNAMHLLFNKENTFGRIHLHDM